jgi:hypothetical protein
MYYTGLPAFTYFLVFLLEKLGGPIEEGVQANQKATLNQ